MRFRKEYSKSKIFIVVKSLATVIPLVAIYWQDLDLVFRDALVNDFMNYILVLPFLIGYTMYRKRRMLKAVSPLSYDEQEKKILTGQLIIGISLSSISFVIYFFGSRTSYALEYHLLSLPFFVAGCIALVFNLETLRTLLFPMALLFFIQPYLIQIANPFWLDLSSISSTSSYSLLSAMGIPAKFTTVLEVPTIEITTINGETLPFTVGVASSGLNSFMGFTVFAIFLTYILREPLWKRVTLMFIGYPLLILLNTLRITIILSLAYQWGMVIAEVFHLTGGMLLIFIGTMLLLLIGEKIWKVKIYRIKTALSHCPNCDNSLSKGSNFCVSCGKLLKSVNHVIKKRGAMYMALAIFVTVLFLMVQTPPIALAKPPTQIDLMNISPDEAKQLLPTISGWNLTFLYRDTKVEEILRQDAALAFAYVSTTTVSNSSYRYIVVTVQISTNRHTWEASLVTLPSRLGRPTATVLDLRDIRILQNPILTARFFAYRRHDSSLIEVVLYWFERVPFKIGSVWDMRNVQISIWSYTKDLAASGSISSSEDLAGVEKAYLPFAQTITNYWQPIKTSSQIITVISLNEDKVAPAVIASLTGTTILFVIRKRKEMQVNTYAYQKLSRRGKRLIDIIHKTEKTTTPTLDVIVAQYERITGESINKEKLLQRVVDAEKTGFVRSDIVSRQDEPVQTWKTQIAFRKAFETNESEPKY